MSPNPPPRRYKDADDLAEGQSLRGPGSHALDAFVALLAVGTVGWLLWAVLQ